MSTFSQLFQMSRTGLLSRMLDMDTVSHNLANFNTVGFKQSRLNFKEMLTDAQYNGLRLSSSQLFMHQGEILMTENPLDLTISGEGWFAVRLPDDRIAYTRNGQFKMDVDRTLVDVSGHPLVWEGEIPLEAESVDVGLDGTVNVMIENQWQEAGKIQLHRCSNPSGLLSFGENLWLETEASGQFEAGDPITEGYGSIYNHSVEGSNVDVGGEMVHLITLQRGYEIMLRALSQTDQMMGQALRMRKA